MIVVNNRITPLDGMIISAIKDIQSEKVVLENIAFDKVVEIEDMHGNMFAKQPKIIRCKDCRHYKFADNRAFGFPVKRCEWTGFEDIDDDDFCSRAERRQDEQI